MYNENGLRVQKTVNGVVTNYTLYGKTIHHMTQGNNELHFFYDASNKPAVVVYNGVPYSYVKNLQGDIVAILDANGAVVVSYVYDAWGRPISCSGTMANTLGEINPFRYRGYVYDEETGLYYLRSRYYKGRVDGVYGEQTMQAVVAFGKAEGLGTGEYAGPKVKNRLFDYMYAQYDYRQDEKTQSFWDGYNTYRQELKWKERLLE